jgi:hypothetical protein
MSTTTATLTRSGLAVRVHIDESDHGPVLRIDGLNCHLDGEQPGEYYLKPITPDPPRNLGPDAEFIGAGDEVVILDGEGRPGDTGILVHGEHGAGMMATVNVDGDWREVPHDRVAHTDSHAALSDEELTRLALNVAVIESLDLSDEGDPLCPECKLAGALSMWANDGEDPTADRAECQRTIGGCGWNVDDEEIAADELDLDAIAMHAEDASPAELEQIIDRLTDELDAMDRDGRFDSQRDRYHAVMQLRGAMFDLRKP